MMNSQPITIGAVLPSLLFACVTVPLWAQQLPQSPLVAGQAAHRSAVAAPQQIGTPSAAVQNPLEPEWWRSLTPAQHKHIDDILKYWEFKSSDVKRYRCVFRRWTYDPVFGPADPNTAASYCEGEIKYSAPDKGLFRVQLMKKHVGGKYEDVQDGSEFDHWICDGQWVYYFDHQEKKLVQRQLPPEMRGKEIGKGPLPFLFNAKADDIKRRFWVHVVTPPNVSDEYHLEAVPRLQEEAANYKMVRVILAREDFLPKAMVVFERNFTPAVPSRTTYEFNQREVNFNILAEKLNLFHREFFEPATPSGWTKQVIPFQGLATPNAGNTAGAPAETTATRR
jgi:TIGR03009 family protein